MSLPLDKHESRARIVGKWGAAARWAIGTSALVSLAQVAIQEVAAAEGKPVGVWWRYAAAHGAVDSCLQAIAMLADLIHHVAGAVAMIAFLRWLALLVRAARALGTGLKESPSNAVLSFFVPIANFVLPVRVLRAIASALAPDRLPEPPVRMVADGSAGYRGARLVAPPAAQRLPATLITLWWATYFIAPCCVGFMAICLTAWLAPSRLLSYALLGSVSGAVHACVQLVAAFCAMRMVRVLTLLLDERLRRIRHNPEEVLRQVGLVLE